MGRDVGSPPTARTYAISEQPGSGQYRCQKCQKFVTVLLGPEEQLPPCGNCGSDKAVRYAAEDTEAEISHGPGSA